MRTREERNSAKFTGSRLIGVVIVLCGFCWATAAVAAPQFVKAKSEPGLVAYWRFDTATNALPDLSGHGHTAQLTNVKTTEDGGKIVGLLDGTQKILVPSASELNLQRGFSLVAKVKVTGNLDKLIIACKDKQYLLRVDQQEDGGHFSFFPYVDSQWESRVRTIPPQLDAWYHLAATWDGSQAMLWVNGLPFAQTRRGSLPPPNDAPLALLTSLPQGGLQGAVEYVKIYRRALAPREIVGEAFGIANTAERTAATSFDFAAGSGLDGWNTQEGATVTLADGRLVVTSKTPQSLAVYNR